MTSALKVECPYGGQALECHLHQPGRNVSGPVCQQRMRRGGNPNCATIGYLLKVNGGGRSISDFVDFAQVQGFLRDRINSRLEPEPFGAQLRLPPHAPSPTP